ncbi:MAG TPA: serine/threonine-protein kinase [Longimicrobiaceae bacterium]|nr:serine/threonine-protein kinase [Longimicrobiaceae bacterium]
MSDLPQDPLVGTIIAGRYRLIEKLGEGAMGAVYLGEHLKIGRRDAIKVLRDSIVGDPEAIARFTRGARNVSAIQHPNVCCIYDFSDTAEGLPFLAMEFIPGETLQDLLKRETVLPLERAVRIAGLVAAGLQAAHEAGIVHRDLKPANIMVARTADGSDVIKVVDFDIAKGSSDGEGAEVTRLGFVVGTPEYMSPEQLAGDRLDGTSDIYSLALVLFRMLTGALPFRAETTQDVMIERLTERPLPLDQVAPRVDWPPELQRVLDHALERRPTDRHASAAAFATEITQAVSGDRTRQNELPETRISGARTEPTIRAKLPSAWRKWGVAAAGAALVAVVVAAASLMRGTAPEEVPAAIPSGLAEAPPPVTAAAAEIATVTDSLVATAIPEEPEAEMPVTGMAELSSVTTEIARPAGVAISDAGIVVPVGEANEMLWRQLDLLGPPYPSRADLNSIRDTLEAVWNLDGVVKEDRAFAAYILGSTWFALGDRPRCATWIERALQLRPDGPGFAAMLDNCAGTSS